MSNQSAALRRSPRIAALAAAHAQKVRETPARIKSMFDAMATESFNNVQNIRELNNLPLNCAKAFLWKFSHLPKDHPDRSAAEAVALSVRKIPWGSGNKPQHLVQTLYYQAEGRIEKRKRVESQARLDRFSEEIKPIVELAVKYYSSKDRALKNVLIKKTATVREQYKTLKPYTYWTSHYVTRIKMLEASICMVGKEHMHLKRAIDLLIRNGSFRHF
jgi:hypothetical protein